MITNSYFIIFFLFICQNVGNFKGFLLVGLIYIYITDTKTDDITRGGSTKFERGALLPV